MARYFPPRRVVAAPPPSVGLTKNQADTIMNNLGIEPAKSDDELSPFAKACVEETPVITLIDAFSGPSDLESRRDWGLSPAEWHEGVRQALAHHAREYIDTTAGDPLLYIYNLEHGEYEDVAPFDQLTDAIKRIDDGIDHDVDSLANYEIDCPSEKVTVFFKKRHDGVMDHYVSARPMTRSVPISKAG